MFPVGLCEWKIANSVLKITFEAETQNTYI